jgi:hypothetical protein
LIIFKNKEISILINHHIYEFQNLKNFYNRNIFNIAERFLFYNYRDETFNCSKINGYFDENENICKKNFEIQLNFQKGKFIKNIDIKFNDVNETINEIDSYIKNDGKINPRIVCELYKKFKGSKEYSNCLNEITTIKNDIELLKNLNFKYLFEFLTRNFEYFLFISYENNDEIEIFNIPYHFNHTTITFERMNTIKFNGHITNFFISENSQHLLANTNRFKWELDSELQKQKICRNINLLPDISISKNLINNCKNFIPT